MDSRGVCKDLGLPFGGFRDSGEGNWDLGGGSTHRWEAPPPSPPDCLGGPMSAIFAPRAEVPLKQKLREKKKSPQKGKKSRRVF